MQQTASWKFWVCVGIMQISLLTPPAWSQSTATPSAPGPGLDAKAYVTYGIENGGKGDLVAAIGAFNQAIAVDPKFAPAYFFRAKAEAQQNKLDAAMADYSHAIQFDATYKDAYYQRGTIEGQKGDFDAAISDFNAVIKFDPKYAPAFYQSGHVKYFQGDAEGALNDLNQSISLDPSASLSYFIRGLLRHAQAHRATAAADFQKSFDLGFPDAAIWIWIIDLENGRHGDAQKELADALNKPESFKPDDWPTPIANYLLGKITQDQLIAKAAADDAQANYRTCEAWFYSGMQKKYAGDAQGAADCFAKAIATGAKGSEEFIEASRELSEVKSP